MPNIQYEDLDSITEFVAYQAEVQKLTEVLNAPVINGYISSTKKLQNPREVFPLPFHVAASFESYVTDDRRPPSSRLIYFLCSGLALHFRTCRELLPLVFRLQGGLYVQSVNLAKRANLNPQLA